MVRRGSNIWAGFTLLVLYVLGGGWGLPVLDAVVYHTAGAADSGSHIEPDGGCGHGDGCILGVATPPSRAAVGHVRLQRPAAALRPAPLVRPEPPPRSPLRSSQHPRAPPVQIA